MARQADTLRSDRRKHLMTAILASVLIAGPAAAQRDPDITRLDVPLTSSGEAYRKSVRFGRIESELYYVDTLNGEIPLGRPPKLARPPDVPEPVDGPDWRRLAIFGGILAALIFLFLRAGGGFGALAVRKPGDADRAARNGAKRSARDRGNAGSPKGLLAQISAMPDRRAALILLLQHSLRQAAKAHDLRLGRSETARDILRRLPTQWVHAAALRRLVMAEELVQFGGRALAEATFEECLRTAAPILRGAK